MQKGGGFKLAQAIDKPNQFGLISDQDFTINNPWKSLTQKGNAYLGLGQFDAAKDCYETLRTLGDNNTADRYLKKLDDAQERDASFCFVWFIFVLKVFAYFQIHV